MGINTKIAVCHLISGDLWAGAEVQAFSLLQSLRTEQGLDLSVITFNDGKLATLLKQTGIPVTIIDETRFRFLRLLEKAAGELAGRRIDILHSHRYKENLLGLLLKRRCEVGHLVQTAHGAQEPQRGLKELKGRLYGLLNRRVSGRFDRIIAVSDDLRRTLSKRFDSKRIVTIHNAIDVSRVTPKRPADVVRKELGIGQNQPVIGAVGRMVPVKGFDRFLQTAATIAEKRSDVVFLLVGDGPLRAEYEQQVRSMGLERRIRLTGFRDDIWDILNCLDLFVMTSYHEGIPIGLLEAMALRRPVVAMRVGGIPEVVEHDLSGVLVDSGDINQMAEVCLELLAHPSRAQTLGDAGRQRVEAEFSIEIHRSQMIRLYRDVAMNF
jgi:L-malate glycosyltransferase